MLNFSVISVILAFTLLMAACSERQSDITVLHNKEDSVKTVHSGVPGQAVSGESAVTEALKKQVLPEFPAMPIGKALDGYSHFTNHEWKGTQTETGKYYVDCIGWLDTKTLNVASLKDGVSKRGVAVKFVVVQDGSFRLAMVSKLVAKTDGSIVSSPLEDAMGILGKIYGNREISF